MKMTFDGDEYCTPDWLFNDLNRKWNFTLDPCCLPNTARAEKFFTPSDNGLIQSWAGEIVFCNPPYSRYQIPKWVKKCSEESAAAVIVALLPSDTSCRWFHDWVYPFAQLEFIKGRVPFHNPYDRSQTFRPRFGSLIAVYGSLTLPTVRQSSIFEDGKCQCGKLEDPRFSPCCSLDHWYERFMG